MRSLLTCLIALCGVLPAQMLMIGEASEGFVTLFNGRDIEKWDGDPRDSVPERGTAGMGGQGPPGGCRRRKLVELAFRRKGTRGVIVNGWKGKGEKVVRPGDTDARRIPEPADQEPGLADLCHRSAVWVEENAVTFVSFQPCPRASVRTSASVIVFTPFGKTVHTAVPAASVASSFSRCGSRLGLSRP